MARRAVFLPYQPKTILNKAKRALNKRIVEKLAKQIYDLEIREAAPPRIWALRKAAWAIEDLPQDIGLVYR